MIKTGDAYSRMLRTVAQYKARSSTRLSVVRSRRRAWSLVFAKREMLAMCVDQDSFLLKVTPRMRKSLTNRFVKGTAFRRLPAVWVKADVHHLDFFRI